LSSKGNRKPRADRGCSAGFVDLVVVVRVRVERRLQRAHGCAAGNGSSINAQTPRQSLTRQHTFKQAVRSIGTFAYHFWMKQAGVVAQGLLQYLAAVASTQVWNSFGSWLRTIRPGVAPSEFVVAGALRQTLPGFLLNNREQASIAKFIGDNQNLDTMEMFAVAA
jgi:hypothetical protein